MVTVEVNLINSISLVKTDPGCGVRTAEDQNSEQYAPPQKKKKKNSDRKDGATAGWTHKYEKTRSRGQGGTLRRGSAASERHLGRRSVLICLCDGCMSAETSHRPQ